MGTNKVAGTYVWNNGYLAENLKGREMLVAIGMSIWLLQYAVRMVVYLVVRHLTCPVAGLIGWHAWLNVKVIVVIAWAFLKKLIKKKKKKKKKKNEPKVI